MQTRLVLEFNKNSFTRFKSKTLTINPKKSPLPQDFYFFLLKKMALYLQILPPSLISQAPRVGGEEESERKELLSLLSFHVCACVGLTVKRGEGSLFYNSSPYKSPHMKLPKHYSKLYFKNYVLVPKIAYRNTSTLFPVTNIQFLGTQILNFSGFYCVLSVSILIQNVSIPVLNLSSSKSESWFISHLYCVPIPKFWYQYTIQNLQLWQILTFQGRFRVQFVLKTPEQLPNLT